jgi:hypothetical protein
MPAIHCVLRCYFPDSEARRRNYEYQEILQSPEVNARYLSATICTGRSQFQHCGLEQARRLYGGSRKTVIQKHDQIKAVQFEDIPGTRSGSGHPSSDLLSTAEQHFLQWAIDELDEDVIGWECRLDNAAGPLLSKFRVIMPADHG